MKSKMKKLLVLAALTLMATTAMMGTTGASASGNVIGTFTVADLGQGIWGGGSLFANGTAGGNVAFSALNGQVIFHIDPTSWSWAVPQQVAEVCFTSRVIRNEAGFPVPPSFCADLPVTGTPVIVDGFVMRLTLTR